MNAHPHPTADIPTPDTDASLPETLPGFDLTQALLQLGGKRSLLLKLLRRMASDYTGSAQAIEQAMLQGHIAEAHRLVHSLKGVAATLVAPQLQHVAQTIESALEANDVAQAVEWLPKLHQAQAEISHSLHSLRLSAPITEPSTPAPLARIDDSLHELQILLQERNIKARKVYASLRSSLLTSAVPELTQLDDAINHLDFHQAQQHVAALLERESKREHTNAAWPLTDS